MVGMCMYYVWYGMVSYGMVWYVFLYVCIMTRYYDYMYIRVDMYILSRPWVIWGTSV